LRDLPDGSPGVGRGVPVFGELVAADVRERLAEIVRGCSGMSADAIAGSVEDAALEAEDGRARDDIAVVVVQVANGH